jgi:CBS domain-containing protein
MLRIRDIMTHDVVTVSPELSLREAMDLFTTRHVSGAPVASGTRVLGVVSLTDLAGFAAALPGVPSARPQEIDVMEAEGSEEEARMWNEGDAPPATFFVEDWTDAGAEVVERFAETEGPEWNVLEEHTVSEAMTRTICSLAPDTAVDHAADTMRRAGIHRVLVMQNGELLGIVTTTDIAKAVADHRVSTRTYVFNRNEEFDERGWK